MGTSWETLPVLDFVRLDARDIGPGPGTTPVRSGHEHVADLSSLCRVLSHGTRERGRRVETRAAGEARRQGRTTKFGEVERRRRRCGAGLLPFILRLPGFGAPVAGVFSWHAIRADFPTPQW